MKHLILGAELVCIFTLLFVNSLISNKLKDNQLITNKSKNVSRSVTFGNILSMKLPEPQVLAISEDVPTPIPTPVPTSKPSKSSYLIAAIGDSMVDTMGSSLDYLAASLKKKYPGTSFAFYNYGKGSENVEEALARFDKPFTYMERNYPPIPHLNADILIVGSYAYNPLTPHDKNKHRQLLSSLVEKAKGTHANVYLLSEIAPLGNEFGKGPNGVNWPEDLSYSQSIKIIENLDNTNEVAKASGVNLVDVYEVSTEGGSKFGKKVYVDTNDGIHPSRAGQILTADSIAKLIELH